MDFPGGCPGCLGSFAKSEKTAFLPLPSSILAPTWASGVAPLHQSSPPHEFSCSMEIQTTNRRSTTLCLKSEVVRSTFLVCSDPRRGARLLFTDLTTKEPQALQFFAN